MDKLNADIWDNDQKNFNISNVQVLLDHLTGKPNATMNDIEALFSGDPIYTNATTEEASGEGDPNGTYHQEYSSKVVKSDLLNRNANKITPGIGDNDKSKGLCVTLKGKEFRVTSLTRTLPTAQKPDGDIVATLLLREPESKVQWNFCADNDSLSAEPSNMYGTSDIRQALIGKGGWLNLFVGGDINFPDSYLVKPKQIGYQYEQSATTRWNCKMAYSLPNDAMGDVKGYYQSFNELGNFENYDYYNNGGDEKRAKYISWGNDFAWLPSLIEIGIDSRNDDQEISIWGMSTYHRGWSDDSHERWVWLRSGNVLHYYHAGCLNSSGVISNTNVDYSHFAIRPALHLNLSAILS